MDVMNHNAPHTQARKQNKKVCGAFVLMQTRSAAPVPEKRRCIHRVAWTWVDIHDGVTRNFGFAIGQRGLERARDSTFGADAKLDPFLLLVAVGQLDNPGSFGLPGFQVGGGIERGGLEFERGFQGCLLRIERLETLDLGLPGGHESGTCTAT